MQAQLRPYIISRGLGERVSSEVVLANSPTDVMRAVLISDYSPPSRRGEPGLGPNDGLLVVLAQLLSGKSSFYELTVQNVGILANARGRNSEQIIASLPDRTIEKLFEYVFTGGEGEQEGNPGKEWRTITVTPLPVNYRSVYDKFDPSRHRDANLRNLFSSLEANQPTSPRSQKQSQTFQSTTFVPLPSLSHHPLSPMTVNLPGQFLQMSSRPNTSIAADRQFIERQMIDSAIDTVVESFNDGDVEPYAIFPSRGPDQDKLDYLVREIEKLATNGRVDLAAIFNKHRIYTDAYLRRAALEMMLDDDSFARNRGGIQTHLAADREVERLRRQS